ncbi:MAG: UbiA family prenyltransferase [Gemmatimonadota bacterium]|nr:MAG: UbiA family prenyltransferase [Gemmatimonadota bacterium]
MTAPRLDGQTLVGKSYLVGYANFVKLPHTVFALPFALLGVVYASWTAPISLRQVALVVIAFTAARFAAMGFNRIVDRHIDGINPRTQARELPAGKLSKGQAASAVVLSAVLFVLCAGMLNPLCLMLSPLALAWTLVYSYTKRFTSWSHLWLGTALAIAPVGGYLAITGSWSSPWWTLAALAIAVLTWVGGFDIFYALQDEDFDREHGLHSAVVLLGKTRSILVGKALHGVTILGLLAFGFGVGLGIIYYLGVAVAAVLLAWEHYLVRPKDLSRLDAAFFKMNGIISIVVFLGSLGDRLL